jgi:hypothetical protein
MSKDDMWWVEDEEDPNAPDPKPIPLGESELSHKARPKVVQVRDTKDEDSMQLGFLVLKKEIAQLSAQYDHVEQRLTQQAIENELMQKKLDAIGRILNKLLKELED